MKEIKLGKLSKWFMMVLIPFFKNDRLKKQKIDKIPDVR